MTDAPAAKIYRYQDDGRLEAHDVQPEGVFSRELLAQSGGEHLIYDGQTITLAVHNGRWVWIVTGESPDGSVIYGRWPD